MNVERLLSVAEAINEELNDGHLPERISNLRAALDIQVQNPADPAPQQQISEILRDLRQVLPNSGSNSWAAPEQGITRSLGFEGLLGDPLLTTIDEVFSRNAITPSVVLEVIQPLEKRLVESTNALVQLITSLEYFRLGPSRLEDQCEVSISIPRSAVEDDLESLGEEFEALAKILGAFQEVVLGSRPQLLVREISSSDFAVFLWASYLVGLAVLKGIQTVADTFNSIVNLRSTRRDLAAAGVPDKVLDDLDAHIESVMEERIKEYVALVIAEMVEREGSKKGRENELANELQKSLNGIANRVSKGYEFDVRVPDDEGETAESDDEGVLRNREIVRQIRDILESGGPRAFPPVEGSTLSLPEGDAS